MGFVPEHTYYFMQDANPTNSTVLCACLVKQNAAKLQTFQAFVNRSILQTRLNPNESAVEVILGTPLIDIVCQKISAKFLTNILQQRELFIKNEGTVTFVNIHRNILKTFYNKKTLT